MGKMLNFHVKFVQTDRRIDRWTDRRTTVKQYAPDLSRLGHKNVFLIVSLDSMDCSLDSEHILRVSSKFLQ